MSAVTAVPPSEDDERIATIVRFHDYAEDTHGHLVRTAELVAAGDLNLLKDLLLVVEFLWG